MFAQVVLVSWIVVSVAMFALMTPVRAFLLTYIVGILFLPVKADVEGVTHGAIVITQSLVLTKLVACHIGALLGTVIFAPQVLGRYRFHWVDAAFLLVIVGQFVTPVVNGIGPKEGVSLATETVRDYLPLLFLARLYLTSVGDVYQAMRAIIGAAFVYSAICVLEWRFSPQLHRLIYGYFQHDFIQYMRNDHFRPGAFLRHAIEVSGFMGMSTALAIWLWYKKLFKPLWGVVPVEAVIVAVGIGLLATMTVSGIAEMLIAVALLGLFLVTRTRWVLAILPVVAIVWMFGRYTEVIDKSVILQTTGQVVNQQRMLSLQYRLEAEELNLSQMDNHLLLGKSPQLAFAKNSLGRLVALDAWWLIQITFYGIVGVAAWYLIWLGSIVELFRRWKRLTPDLQTIGVAVGILIGAQFIDFLFNSFSSMFLLILNVGMVSALQRYVPVRAKRRVMVQQQPGGAGGPNSPEVAMP